ncbi:hypothetical protein AERO8C_120073 [Aeromonas veronii]|uniref:Uncharacterized protein n=1 Tax=Aeromonas veronii TaxID=654 RepID=A0A653KSH2_AERVE|nr:hypothetical protein AERO8C_120073 [Aeromonas veronii]
MSVMLMFIINVGLLGSQARLLATVTGFLHGFQDAVIVVEAIGADGARLDRGAQGTAGIVLVGTVAELAATQVVAEFDEAPGDAVGFQMPEGELADPGGVDEIATARKVVEPRRGGGVLAEPRVFGDLAGEHIQPRHQGVGERGFAHPGLADEDADLVGELGFQLIEPFTALAAHQQHLVIELAVGFELALDARAGGGIKHIDLVQHDEGADLHILGGHQIAVDDVGGELGHYRRDDDDLVDVGGDGFDPVVEVRPGQYRVARMYRLDDARCRGIEAGTPHHLVAAHQTADAAAPQVAAVDGAIDRFHVCVLTKTTDHHPFDGGAKQGVIHHCGVIFLQPPFAVGLDAPLLTQIEFCFLCHSIRQFMNRSKASMIHANWQNSAIPPNRESNHDSQRAEPGMDRHGDDGSGPRRERGTGDCHHSHRQGSERTGRRAGHRHSSE